MQRKNSATVVIVLVILIIFILGGVWYYYLRPRSSSVPVATGTNQTSTSSTSILPTLSFITLLPDSACPQLTAALSNPPIITNAAQFFEPCAVPPNIDTGTFSIVGSGSFGVWAKDKDGVYFYQIQGDQESGGQIIEIQGADPSTFTIVPSSSALYYKDTNYVYNFAIQNGVTTVTTTPNVDAASFVGLGNNYFKDKNNVYYLDAYWNWSVVDGADPATFQYVGSYAAPDGESYAIGIAKDKNCIFRGTSKILSSNNTCISSVGCTSSSLASNPSSCGIQ